MHFRAALWRTDELNTAHSLWGKKKPFWVSVKKKKITTLLPFLGALLGIVSKGEANFL